jgi:hypothetical protein
MSVRISSDQTKVGYVVAAYVLGIFVAISSALVAGVPQAGAVTGIFLLVTVGFAVRNFRGDGEPVDAPRKWWRMTWRPTSGFVFAVVFLVQASSSAFAVALAPGRDSEAYVVMALVYAFLGALFTYSSIRLRSLAKNHKS